MRTFILSLAALGVLIQLVPVQRDNPPAKGNVTAPPEVASILRRSCYDCHSNETVWPWYSYAAPVSWLVASDVHGGRRKLNFSEWKGAPDTAQKKHVTDIPKEVKDADMPLWYYLPLHSAARLSPDDVTRLSGWAERLSSP
jgi:hypothetical protein